MEKEIKNKVPFWKTTVPGLSNPPPCPPPPALRKMDRLLSSIIAFDREGDKDIRDSLLNLLQLKITDFLNEHHNGNKR